MKEEVNLQLSKENLAFAKRKADYKGKSVSEIVDDYIKTFRKIEEGAKVAKRDPFIRKFGGMLSSNKNERVR
jgi:hypothetical protein